LYLETFENQAVSGRISHLYRKETLPRQGIGIIFRRGSPSKNIAI